jgi:purine-binding chemotaxis protein CheW
MSAMVRKRHDRAAARRAADIGKRVEYVAFSLAGEAYAVPIARIAEILKPLPITPVPRSPKVVIGVMTVRGRLVTVIDLRRRLGLPEAPIDSRSRILITDTGEERIGLFVDEVLQVHRLAESEIEPRDVLGGDPESYLAGIGRPEGALLSLLDLRPILES